MDRTDAAAARAADRLGRLAGVTVAVPDPAATAAFLCDGIGFLRGSVAGDDDAIAIVCEGDYGPRGQTAITLERSERGGDDALTLRAVTWEVSDGYDFEALATRARAAGAEASATRHGGVFFRDPAGNPISVEPADALTIDKPAAGGARPRRLGHLNLKADRPPVAAAFYQDVLRLKLSEQIGENLFFLRLGSEHHNLGLRPGARGMLHHLGCELSGWHAYQPILDRLAANDWKVEYGPGRHVPGRNLFTYVVEPSSGLRVELFADMAQLADEGAHEPVRWEPGDRMTKTINTWGPTPPESFLA